MVLWLKRFIECLHAIKDNPELLLLDRHESYGKPIEVFDLACEHEVICHIAPLHIALTMEMKWKTVRKAPGCVRDIISVGNTI